MAKTYAPRDVARRADEFVQAVAKTAPKEGLLRESAYDVDALFVSEAFEFNASVARIVEDSGEPFDEVIESIMASAYRDARVVAEGRGFHGLSKEFVREERRHIMKMWWHRGGWAGFRRSALYLAWGVSCRFGTSVGRWFTTGAVIMLLYSVAYFYANVTPADASTNALSPLLASAKAFTLLDFGGVKTPSLAMELLVLSEGLLGLGYFGFGFSLLLTTFSPSAPPPSGVDLKGDGE